MNTKPKCKCTHTATQHANVKYTNKKGETKNYTNCRVCECKKYEPTIIDAGTPPEFAEVFTQGTNPPQNERIEEVKRDYFDEKR